MIRSRIVYLLAYLPILIIFIVLSYLGYEWRVKKYKRIFFKTLRKEGIPRKIAHSLVKEIKILKLRDFLKNENMRNIW